MPYSSQMSNFFNVQSYECQLKSTVETGRCLLLTSIDLLKYQNVCDYRIIELLLMITIYLYQFFYFQEADICL